MAGYPLKCFTIHGYDITALRNESGFFIKASSKDKDLNRILSMHIATTALTKDEFIFNEILENAVNEFNSQQ